MSTLNSTVAHNSYFEGKVQSLVLSTEKGPATVGVMKKGDYRFSTSVTEHMVIISGSLTVKLPEGDWKTYQQQESFDVAAGVAFDVSCTEDVAYICYYGA
ncbi:pyrimidine/purine nucleoside phosphorylase [Chitinophaga arvensicola]|uniref:Uncharacterized protein n=1 Tax=Chitinophaga arvensicola TaxID=29529 RepID=A0A1I0QZP6_9BACT|nr:pyrimidine/purine nucleoside phosphorylase [Chitinophaga arvensicola]SEW32635.1 hypothetical protein SAMN04488122_1885 [Chitinophaga arvensicola]